ncbi:MAG TPA: hypothetical protein VEX36_01645 [Thermoleophilaceae bacterium]|nr:hypothetical protein [Thermoleophilaceae bacterium]
MGVADAADMPDPRDYTLRLSDLRPGYEIGSDNSCDFGFGVGETADHDPYYLLNGCNVGFQQLWSPKGAVPGPASVDSYVKVMPTAAEATARFKRERERNPRPGLRQQLGDQAVLYRRVDRPPPPPPALRRWLRRHGSRGAVDQARAEIDWRSGRFLGSLLLHGSVRSVTKAETLRLARLQQARIEMPTALTAAEVDDTEVPLDSPHFGVPVLWLGRVFDPPGPLPALELDSAYGGYGDFDEGPGWTGELQYKSERHSFVVVGIWKPTIWRRSVRRRFGRLVWGSRCASSTSFPVRVGRATVYAGYGVRPNRCDGRRHDSFMAIIRHKRVIVTLNMPHCYTCGTGGGPYGSLTGMKAVAEALHPRPRLP